MKNYFIGRLLFFLTVLIALNGCKKSSPVSSPEDKETHATFTTAEKIDLPGCGNLYKVSDVLYRGEQPTAEGFKELEKLGIKTVVNLRSFHSDTDEMEGTNLGYEHIRMEAWDPEQDEVEAFLKVVTDPQKQPVFVHCMHGADRTGTMVSVYRIVAQGWQTQKAVDEMKNGPFGFHEIWTGLPEFLKNLDIEGLKKEFPTKY